jgi:hypothetical protein
MTPSQNDEKLLLASSGLSVHVEQLGSRRKDFHEISYFNIFRQPAEKIEV